MKTSWVLILALFLQTCIEPFVPPESEYRNLLVVQGFITDLNEPYSVRLSRTYPIDTTAILPVNGAQVSVLDGQGNEYLFTSHQNGLYQSDPMLFRGQPGETYRLKIRTAAGEEIESKPVIMKVSPPIDSLFWAYEPRFTDTGSDPVPGVQVYLSTHDPAGQTRYYRWEWVETWEFLVPLYSAYVVENGRVQGRLENISRCWRSQPSAEIITGTTVNLAEDRVSRQPLRYISTDNNRLGIQYSVEARQFALSEEAHNFWTSLYKVNQSLGTLFDPQPASVQGNLISTSDPGTPVLGYFDASTVTRSRIFIRRQDLPEGVQADRGFRGCVADTVLMADVIDKAAQGFNVLNEVRNMAGSLIGYTMGSIPCSDCRLNGTTVKPEFWP